MPIESRIPTDQVDIKHLSIEPLEAEDKIELDPAKLITEQHWERFKKYTDDSITLFE